MKKIIMLATTLLCLPMAAEAARLVSAPLTLTPSDGDAPRTTGVIEKITCSIHYSGSGTVNGTLRMTNDNRRSGGLENSPLSGGGAVTLSPGHRNYSATGIIIGDWPVEGVVCDFNFPGVAASQFRALLCVTEREERNVTACVPIY